MYVIFSNVPFNRWPWGVVLFSSVKIIICILVYWYSFWAYCECMNNWCMFIMEAWEILSMWISLPLSKRAVCEDHVFLFLSFCLTAVNIWCTGTPLNLPLVYKWLMHVYHGSLRDILPLSRRGLCENHVCLFLSFCLTAVNISASYNIMWC